MSGLSTFVQILSHDASGVVHASLAVPPLAPRAGAPPPRAPSDVARRGRPPSVPGAVHPVRVPTRGPVVALLRPQSLPDAQRDGERVEPPVGRRLSGREVYGVRRPSGRGTDAVLFSLLFIDLRGF